ncbi:MAG: hypothetical protein IJ460_08515 [Clostridia bacterium]|nr:hypothetical protein [Clostridia bacterium]
MKQQLDKSGVLYKSMLRGRTKLTVIFVLLFVLFCVYTVDILPYLEKKAIGAVPLDAVAYAETAETVVVSESFEPDKNLAKIYGYAQPEQSYWEADRYFFSVNLESLENTGLAYTASGAVLTADTDTEADPVAVKVDFVDIGGLKTAVLSMGDAEITEGMISDGILTEISPLILDNLADFVPEGEIISKYMLDVRGIDMSSEFSDTVTWFALIVVLIFLIAKLVLYYLRPIKHPTYKQLEKYGEVHMVAQDIETQIRAGTEEASKNEIRTPDWIITKRSFYHKVEKNFTAKGSFKYTPYEK